eukprot:jgi/Bigna1/79835/fgenesh1_pg.65_\
MYNLIVVDRLEDRICVKLKRFLSIGTCWRMKARTQVEISMGLRNLRSKDMFSKSDPCIIVFEKQRKAGWVEVARTEVIMNKHNPNFKKRLKMSYYFERRQVSEHTVLLPHITCLALFASSSSSLCFHPRVVGCQEMKFEVWDWDTNAADKSTRNQDYIGCVETTLANLVVDSGMPRKVMKRSGRVAAKGRARMHILSMSPLDANLWDQATEDGLW